MVSSWSRVALRLLAGWCLVTGLALLITPSALAGALSLPFGLPGWLVTDPAFLTTLAALVAVAFCWPQIRRRSRATAVLVLLAALAAIALRAWAVLTLERGFHVTMVRDAGMTSFLTDPTTAAFIVAGLTGVVAAILLAPVSGRSTS